jgi:hypothetical protein
VRTEGCGSAGLGGVVIWRNCAPATGRVGMGWRNEGIRLARAKEWGVCNRAREHEALVKEDSIVPRYRCSRRWIGGTRSEKVDS